MDKSFGKAFAATGRHMDFIKSRAFQRVAAMAVAFSLIVTLTIMSMRGTHVKFPIPSAFRAKVETCASKNEMGNQTIWGAAKAKYNHLMDDKFTIVMLTYRRPKELNHTLTELLGEEIPSLHEVVIVWGDIEAEPPAGFVTKHGISVRYRKGIEDSLNEKLRPDPDYKTQAVLLTDDDVYYKPKDLEFVFQSWRKFGKFRLTGALARCSTIDKDGEYNYNFCSNDRDDVYSMILTNLCFSHLSFLDYYWSNDTTMAGIRKYVDDGFNCEDIAFNYMQSLLTGTGPLLVTGQDRYVNQNPSKGISTKPGHLEARSKCLNDFIDMFKCMPLIDETAHVQKGVVVM